ncbi:similar to Saccharomyces cerevisiae YKL193C SDS22 Conserved nuclear regulatory subunit of Glc7p type 1 protein serine-threonine phosphatase (PP1) [Maudiozyma saulgeensis]|uniref:Similar to Saccharomyces cerevisiae YKL193C SDS22 Conserved nuclear regulatory subunit of Glc7p type 1 protein serine-threonine phosphatase (PP1) n=1 Tax=Maudiozyma saulgeensis TaxID=1789683 RepID=A0A1X7QZT9_9SACH|nr:similar to Saccharomyces cerevisiae YKL193C SDS22 Conserved nuclear regulatory subunit of Glc7p type 1 protein serine-threonine phosphatase (PP1) [Kazachstania saulgeensis]
MSEDNTSPKEHEKVTQLVENNEKISTQVPTVIPDEHPDFLTADSELTEDLPDDTESIDLIQLKIRTLEDLNLLRFKQLKNLCLRQNLIQSISEVEVLPIETMTDIDFYDNRIKHISSNLNKLVNLTSLDLSFNNIKHIKNIDNLIKLENLYFVQNKISKIENLNTLTELKNLELGGNNIQGIDPDSFKNLNKIEEIWLGKNSIPRLINLHHLKSLKILSIQGNRLKKLEGLEELENLEELYVSNNHIAKIEGLENNKKLKIIDITSNKITKLENLNHLKDLTDIWASFNQIDQRFEEIGEELKECIHLDTIYLEGNPVQKNNETAYRRKLILNLPKSLEKIDATYVRG